MKSAETLPVLGSRWYATEAAAYFLMTKQFATGKNRVTPTAASPRMRSGSPSP
ncbi:hypothetical protein DIPPA_32493 [Diplonema papillatum]|nr:hypothetical protein DIPPA_32493 [Diplonema papillatum]